MQYTQFLTKHVYEFTGKNLLLDVTFKILQLLCKFSTE